MFTILIASGIFEDTGKNLLVGALVICWLASKFLKSNPQVGDAAKKAAANKAIDIIGKWFK